MKRLRFLTAAVVAAAFSALALAQTPAAAPTATVSWTAPSQYADDTAVPGTDLAFYTVTACRGALGTECLTFKTPAPAAGAGPVTSLVVPLACGSYVMAVTATTTATAHYPNATSGYSNQLTFPTNVTCTPNPPGGVTVTAGGTVTPGIG